MRCLSPAEAEAIFGPDGFSVSTENSWYSTDLALSKRFSERQRRTAARQPNDLSRCAQFIRDINRWLPTNTERLIWVSRWEHCPYNYSDELVLAARRGHGETRSMVEAPGHFFEKQKWDEEDQLEIRTEHERALALIVGIVSLVMITESWCWLIAKQSQDMIGLWEGNIFFYTDNENRLRHANKILDGFSCSRKLV